VPAAQLSHVVWPAFDWRWPVRHFWQLSSLPGEVLNWPGAHDVHTRSAVFAGALSWREPAAHVVMRLQTRSV
jgi:hypothetical protein